MEGMDVENKTDDDEEEEEEDVNELMERVGLDGTFQRRFNYLYNFGLMALVAMASINLVLAITTPEHWCHVSGRNRTNFTLEEWKQLTIPSETVESSVRKINNCRRYNFSIPENYNALQAGKYASLGKTEGCAEGWEYDNTWYSLTVPTQEDWVCEDELYAPHTLTFSKVGEVLGTLVIGQLGDLIGRRPVLFLGVAILVIGRCVSVFTAGNYAVFAAAIVLAGLPNGVIFQTPLIIGMEISSVTLRAHIALLQSVGWTIGMCLMPMIAWATGGDWRLFTLITSVPCAAIFIVYRTFPESPRWLAAKGRSGECLEVLRNIAEVNGTAVPENSLHVLEKVKGKKEKVYGLASLLSSRQLFKNAVLISTCLTIVQLMNFTLVLSVANMSGNPFLNMFLQALMELPGFIIGKIICDLWGRRCSQAGAYLLSASLQFACVLVAKDHNLLWLLIVLVLVVKFCITVAAYCAYLQCMEIYPTCLRQTGTSVGVLISVALGSLGPYIVYLGRSVDARLPYLILGGLCLLGIICALFLPETLNQRLPETLRDAARFGKGQKFWSFPCRRKNTSIRSPPAQ